MSGRRLWDAPSSIKAYYKNNDFEPPAVPGRPDSFPASAGRVGRRLDFRSRAGGSGVVVVVTVAVVVLSVDYSCSTNIRSLPRLFRPPCFLQYFHLINIFVVVLLFPCLPSSLPEAAQTL